jgi:hypothetical protein
MSVRYRLGPRECSLKRVGYHEVGESVSLDAELFPQAERSEVKQRSSLGNSHTCQFVYNWQTAQGQHTATFESFDWMGNGNTLTVTFTVS